LDKQGTKGTKMDLEDSLKELKGIAGRIDALAYRLKVEISSPLTSNSFETYLLLCKEIVAEGEFAVSVSQKVLDKY
jgi:hypothetical protein